MISAWGLSLLLPAVVVGMFIMDLLAAGAHREEVEMAHFEGVKKGHQDMQRRFHRLIKDKGKGKEESK